MFVSTRSCYVSKSREEWQGVKLVACYAPRKKSLEAIVHTFISLCKAVFHRPDIVHIHAIGPSLLVPLARILGFRVVMTTHGPEYQRQKWGKPAKAVLKLGEKLGGMLAHELIVISAVIQRLMAQRCNRAGHLIFNGIAIPEKARQFEYPASIGCRPKRYVLSVARFVEEKGLHDLMEAFNALTNDYKLIIAGDADHETPYSRNLRAMAGRNERIVLTGYITGKPLHELFSHAALFVLPSYYEGLPIALLEALSYDLPVLVSDIPAHKEVPLPPDSYFVCGNTNNLAEKMEHKLNEKTGATRSCSYRSLLEERYDWEQIARQTIQVYESALRNRPGCNRAC